MQEQTPRGLKLSETRQRNRQRHDGYNRLAAAVLVSAWHRYEHLVSLLTDPTRTRYMPPDHERALQEEALEEARFLCNPSPYHEMTGYGPERWRERMRDLFEAAAPAEEEPATPGKRYTTHEVAARLDRSRVWVQKHARRHNLGLLVRTHRGRSLLFSDDEVELLRSLRSDTLRGRPRTPKGG